MSICKLQPVGHCNKLSTTTLLCHRWPHLLLLSPCGHKIILSFRIYLPLHQWTDRSLLMTQFLQVCHCSRPQDAWLFLSGRLECPSEAHFHVPKPNTQVWRYFLFDTCQLGCPCDISRSGSHWHSLFWSITDVQFCTWQAFILDKRSWNVQLLHPIFSF